jgi:quinol monooxygenase YgiN
MSIVYIIRFRTLPELTDAFAARLPETRRDLARVDGCTRVQVFRDQSQPDRFCLVEHWESLEKHRAHMERVVAAGVWEGILRQLAEDPESSYFEEIEALPDEAGGA